MDASPSAGIADGQRQYGMGQHMLCIPSVVGGHQLVLVREANYFAVADIMIKRAPFLTKAIVSSRANFSPVRTKGNVLEIAN